MTNGNKSNKSFRLAKRRLQIIINAGRKEKLDIELIQLFNEFLDYLNWLESLINFDRIHHRYLSSIDLNLEVITEFPFLKINKIKTLDNIYENDFSDIKISTISSFDQKQFTRSLSGQFRNFQFVVNFFNTLDFFENNIVVLGANGSGKTMLTNELKRNLGNGVVVSAQRILLPPEKKTISHVEDSRDKFYGRSASTNKLNKSYDDYLYLKDEFRIIIENLVIDHFSKSIDFLSKCQKDIKVLKPPKTNLDLSLEIWNSMITEKKLEFSEEIEIFAFDKETEKKFPLIQMSEGEKVMLYLIGYVVLAPKNSFIIIDEPEMYLHKTILNKLWDCLEELRTDCLFIYLTHDLDFASSRSMARKVWIKSFEYPDNWELEPIESNEIPEALLMKLLGSKNNILFCEGDTNSIDYNLYSILFSEYTITPVSSCFDVINHTKAFNKLKNLNTIAYGIIDSDFHDNIRLKKLTEKNVFSVKLAEIENLFFDIEFVKLFAEKIFVENFDEEKFKQDVIDEFSRNKEVQVSNYVTTKINYYFSDSDVSRASNLNDIKNNYKNFTDEVKIEDWYRDRLLKIENIIEKNDYESIIKIFNNKGLIRVGAKHLNSPDFIKRGLSVLRKTKEAKDILLKHFPDEIVNSN